MYDDEYEARRSSYRASRERDDYYYPTRGGGGDRRDPYRDSRYGPPRSSYYDRDPYYYAPPPPPSARRGGYEDERRRDYRSASPRRGTSARKPVTPEPEDYELRSIFCSQLAARLGERDLGEFLEEKLGDGSVRDIRIVTDRTTGRSKGIGYVELKHEELVPKAIALTGEKLFGIPIIIQRTEAARNRGEGASTAEAPIRPNLPQPLPILDPDILTKLPLPGLIGMNGATAPILPLAVAGAPAKVSLRTPTVIHANTAARLYVGSLHFNLTAEDVKSVFAPFGEIEYVDLHTEPGTNKSKGFAFVQFKQADDAEKAIQNMNGFELAGRNIKVSHVNAHSRERGDGGGGGGGAGARPPSDSGNQATRTSAYDEGGGAGLSANNRVALMEKLARIDSSSSSQPPAQQQRPATIPQASSKAVLLSNMFDPAEETERDWDVDLGQEVREECEEKYGKVDAVKVDRDSAGEIWLRFSEVDGASKAIAGLNGRFFGGRSITAQFVSESIMSAKFG